MKLRLHKSQYEIATDTHRYKIICAGRRWGKSVLLRSIILSWALKDVGMYWIVTPTHIMGKKIHWLQGFVPELTKMARLNPYFRGVKFNSSDLSITLPNGSLIQIVTAENPERLVGVKLKGLGVDEIARLRNWDLIWKEALRPTLTDFKAPAIFISTPRGYNHFYDLFMQGQEDVSEYKSWKFSSYDNPYLDKNEIEQAKTDLTEDLFQQEYMAEFKRYTGLVYKDFSRELHVREFKEFQAEYYIRGCDRGFRNPSAVVFIAVDKNGIWYQYDEIYITEATTPQLAELIKQKSEGKEFALSTMDSANQSDIQDLRDMKIDFMPTKKMVGEGGVNYVTWKIQKLSERIKAGKYYVNPKCIHTIEEFEKYSYPETKDELNPQEMPIKIYDHALDALADLNGMYLHEYEENIKPPWAGKIPGTYIPPSTDETEKDINWESEKYVNEDWDDNEL